MTARIAPGTRRELGLPIWARGVASRTTRRIGLGGALNLPVSVGGAVVMPGDLVIADEDGVVTLPLSEAPEELCRAEERAPVEARLIAAIEQGHILEDMLPPLAFPGGA